MAPIASAARRWPAAAFRAEGHHRTEQHGEVEPEPPGVGKPGGPNRGVYVLSRRLA